jgi:hypothetical protein
MLTLFHIVAVFSRERTWNLAEALKQQEGVRAEKQIIEIEEELKCIDSGMPCNRTHSNCCKEKDLICVTQAPDHDEEMGMFCDATKPESVGPNDWLAAFQKEAGWPKTISPPKGEPYKFARLCFSRVQSIGAADHFPFGIEGAEKYIYKAPTELATSAAALDDLASHYAEVLKATAPYRKEVPHFYYGALGY